MSSAVIISPENAPLILLIELNYPLQVHHVQVASTSATPTLRQQSESVGPTVPASVAHGSAVGPSSDQECSGGNEDQRHQNDESNLRTPREVFSALYFTYEYHDVEDDGRGGGGVSVGGGVCAGDGAGVGGDGVSVGGRGKGRGKGRGRGKGEVEECVEEVCVGRVKGSLEPGVVHRLVRFQEAFMESLAAHPLRSQGEGCTRMYM